MERRPNLDDLTNIEIIDRYRLDRDGIDYVENILSRQITPKAYRNHAISARHKLLITLRYLATGPIQLNDCDIHGVSQPTISRLLDNGFGGHEQFHLLGDSGYPSTRWLLTPYLNPQGLAQEAYNRSHKTTRSRVEKAIGQLKRRFGVLHTEIALSPEKACKVVIACAVLHNLCKARGIPFADNQDDDNGNNNNGDPRPQDQMPGLRYRDYFAATYFHI
ncbi:HARB1-like protein [Mya arenaria]|uniref:HARB1-like protein n=1 Tax=Mya arenaria TaxID=6604 RepID=A0ABY7DML3_MYAAR|nr:HARB1-like protein [Mya arenaria]